MSAADSGNCTDKKKMALKTPVISIFFTELNTSFDSFWILAFTTAVGQVSAILFTLKSWELGT